MERNRLRAALIALCVLAVIFGASLFPATGFGSYPAGPGGGSRADDSGVPGSGGRTTVGTAPDADDGTGATTIQPTTNDQSADSETTTTTNATAGADPSHPSPGGFRPFRELLTGGGVVLLLVLAVLGIGFRTGLLALGSTGTIPITIGGLSIGELVGKIPARTMGLVVGFSASIPRLADDAIGLLAEVGKGLSAGTVGLGSALAQTVAVIGRGFGGTLLAIGSVGSGLFSMPKVLSRPTLGRSGRKSEHRTAAGGDTVVSDPEERGPPSIEEAWRSMTDRLPVRRRRTTTPAEYARVAIRRGYPSDAVRQLTDAFREVRYGSFPPSESRTKLARAALDEIDRFGEDDE